MTKPEIDHHVRETLSRTGALEDRALWLEMGGLRFAPLSAVRASLKRLGAFGRKVGGFAAGDPIPQSRFHYARVQRCPAFTLYSLTPWKQAHS